MPDITEKEELKIEVPKWVKYQLKTMYELCFKTLYHHHRRCEHFTYEDFVGMFLTYSVEEQNRIFNKLTDED